MIELTEYEPAYIDTTDLSAADGLSLWRRYAGYFEVSFPSPLKADRWVLTSRGWVGHLPISTSLQLTIHPRIAIAQWFDMLTYIEPFDVLRTFKGQVQVADVRSLITSLAKVFADRVQSRLRQGLFRPYQAHHAPLAFIRGRIDLPHHLRTPWNTRLMCRFHQQTPDVADNQLLLWTVHQILPSGLYPATLVEQLRAVEREFRAHGISRTSFSATDCLGRAYHRLNGDYEILHALCYFFLAHLNPDHQVGDHQMIPFLMHMPTVFERFVARWTSQHLPPAYYATQQTVIPLNTRTQFRLDQVIFRADGTPLMVVDTKYKRDASPSTEDISQVVAYAVALGCDTAVLVYPGSTTPTEMNVGNVRVRSLNFDLSCPLEEAGYSFLQALLPQQVT